ncbi:MAG TPA: hypothetical protein VGG62_10565 [Terracidiphilus sp.]|jgi:hypothetical protein
MGRFDAFCGGFNTSISPNITSELTMNWIPERNAVPVNEMGTGVTDKNIRCSLVRTPGLSTFVQLPLAPVRCLWPGENRLLAVGGDHLYEVNAAGTITDRSTPGFSGATGIGPAGGTIGNDGRPVQIFSNGNQILVISAGMAYCDNGNGPVVCSQSLTLNDLVVDPAPAGTITFTDLQLGGMNTIILSPSYTFVAGDVGKTLTITSGTGFTPGTYTVTALLYGGGGYPTGSALVNTGAGTAGSTGGHGSMGTTGATAGYVLTTATGGSFDSTDIGRTVQITGGTGFNVGLTQPILSITSNGGAVGASVWGTAGSSLGTGIEFLGKYTFNDLQLGGMATILVSASHAFVQQDVGQTVTITGGTGFTPGNYTITHLLYGNGGQVTGNAILNAAAGTPGSTGGQGTLGSNQITASSGAFLDGYFFVVPNPPTKTVYFSAINDGTSWNPLDFFVKENYPDNVAALFADHQELYVMGDLESTQVMRDTGAADNPFAPDPGAVMHYGCQAHFSVVRLGNGVAWIGQDVHRGSRRAFHAVGYNPVAVSTPAVEAAWALYSRIDDAVAYTEMLRGHECWIITFPTANATWAYDATTGWWHQRGWWNTTADNWDRIRPWVYTVVNLSGTEWHFAGDWQNSRIYVIGTNYLTDDGAAIWRRRRAPHLTAENKRRFYARFEIDCDVHGSARIFWNRLGCGRDRIWQLDTSQTSETGGVTFFLEYSDDRTQTWQQVFSQFTPAGVDVMLANAYLNWTDATWQ